MLIVWCIILKEKCQFMLYKCHDCHVKKCCITMNNVPLMNTDTALDLDHSLSISATIVHIWRYFNVFVF